MKTLLLFLLIYTINLFGQENVTLQLSWKHQFQFAGYYMAKEKGFYKDVDIDISINEINKRPNKIKGIPKKVYKYLEIIPQNHPGRFKCSDDFPLARISAR